MSVVRLIGFATLSCGCLVGRYREVESRREVTYIEEKGDDCETASHRRNQTMPLARLPQAARPAAG
jgi:hypothetical protein